MESRRKNMRNKKSKDSCTWLSLPSLTTIRILCQQIIVTFIVSPINILMEDSTSHLEKFISDI